MPTRSPTRTEEVYTRLRGDIVSGRLLPGARLPFAELGARYGSSASAIREALQRLVEQGLVVSEPQLGFHIASLSVEDLRDLTTARCEIEGLALRYAIENGDLAWEATIVAALHVLERTAVSTAGPGDETRSLSDDWAAAHKTLHDALFSACPNNRLRTIASGLRDTAELYRHWSWRATGGDSRDLSREHRLLAEAALARDADEAVRLLREHLTTTSELLIDDHSGSGDGTRSNAEASAGRSTTQSA